MQEKNKASWVCRVQLLITFGKGRKLLDMQPLTVILGLSQCIVFADYQLTDFPSNRLCASANWYVNCGPAPGSVNAGFPSPTCQIHHIPFQFVQNDTTPKRVQAQPVQLHWLYSHISRAPSEDDQDVLHFKHAFQSQISQIATLANQRADGIQ